MILDQHQTNTVVAAIRTSWNAVADDALEATPRMSNRVAIEISIDADRLRTFGGKNGGEAQELVSRMIGDAGYGPTLNYLSKKVQLV